MNYPISILLEKTATDIADNAIKLGDERGLPGDLLCTAFEKAYTRIQDKKAEVLTDMVVNSLNELDKATNSSSNETKVVDE